MIEVAALDERQEHKERRMLKDLLHQLQKRREEARGLIGEMQRNFDEAQDRSYETERKLDPILREYIDSSEKKKKWDARTTS